VIYSDAEAAALYDVLNPWGSDYEFYLRLILEADSVLDVGCGTGRLLHRARAAGHEGRLCGIDPDPAMLEVAARRPDVEWVQTAAASLEFESEFALATMTGHAFQMIVGDEEIVDSLRAIRRALVDGGQFAFETRNPPARAWERWDGAETEVVDPSGRALVVRYAVVSMVDGVVVLTETTADRDTSLRIDRGSLRFLDTQTLDRLLADAGFTLEARCGGWRGEPLDDSSEEIVTVASAVTRCSGP
jgi:ubiquinone/menaquinone biosynthesis C-methylase UbiE